MNIFRTLLLLAVDTVLVNLAMIIPFILRFYDSAQTMSYLQAYLKLAPLITLIFLVTFYLYKFYNRAWAYASIGELLAIVQAVTIGSLGVIALTYFTISIVPRSVIPRSVIILDWAFAILLVGASRLTWRVFIENKKKNGSDSGRRALIIGAADAGAMVARELKSHPEKIFPVGFIDNEPGKQKLNILGLPVLGKIENIPSIVKRYNIELVVIAMPAIGAAVIREIIEICRNIKVELKILPTMYQIINGEVSVNHLRPVQLDDLLHREPVQIDLKEIAGYLRGEVVLVTGAGGSIGSELCRQVASFVPRQLIILGHGENSIYRIWLELIDSFRDVPVEIVIADIRDRQKIEYVFKKYQPGVVFHAAAHKHVPLMELHPYEAVKTNVFGTLNVAEAADIAGVKVFVMISTDKAVNPSSVMGGTKRIAEVIVQQKNSVSNARFTAVRFGNVLGSNGSVVPIFQQQISNGGPITVTHPEMKRYFMTIPEAVQLVIQAGSMARGGEVFVLDMGDPLKIVDLARDMIKLSGLEPEKDIAIRFTGIRPGEKLFEEILTAEEGSNATKHKRIFVVKPTLIDVGVLETEIMNLSRKGIHCTAEDIFHTLDSFLPHIKNFRNEQVV